MNQKIRNDLSLKKKLIFSLITILILVGMAELLLRLTGIQSYPTLMIKSTEADGNPIYRINEKVGERYLNHNINNQNVQMPRIYSDTLAVSKPKNEKRIFVLGGSSVQGYPYPYIIAFPAQLEILLSSRFPDWSFHVINCGVTALNSFALVDFTEEILDYQPDLLIVYSGHNEFYGAFGSASSVKSFTRNRLLTRITMKLQRSAVYRSVQSVSSKLAGWTSEDTPQIGLIEIMAKNQAIPWDSTLVDDTLLNFKENVQIICNMAANAGVPVVIGTVVSNVEGLSPMGLLNDDSAYFNSLKTRGLEYLAASDITGTAQIADELKNKFPINAWGSFLAGKSKNLNHPGSGCVELKNARDLDGLRFRAPGRLNDIIRQIGVESGNHVTVVDIEPAFDEYSGKGCPGYDLFVDHVHPTAYGHYLIALTIARQLVETQVLKLPDMSNQPWLEWESCCDIAGFGSLEEMLTQMQIQTLYRRYPLQKLPEAPARIQETTRSISMMYQSLSPTMKEIYERWIKEGGQFDLHVEAGKSYFEKGECEAAIREFEMALKTHRDNKVIEDYAEQSRKCLELISQRKTQQIVHE